MAFFKARHKKMAKRCSLRELQSGYERSEFNLERASYSGDTKALKKAMRDHGDFEYALLYRNTPKFKKKRK